MVRRLALFLLIALSASATPAERLNLAVTASFKPVLDALSMEFTGQTGIQLVISSASTGVLYQQILKGAPYDVFFAADAERPRLLAEQLNLPSGQLGPYAYGQLVLVTATEEVTTLSDLARYQGKVIIANPLHAPYGQAADAVLNGLGFPGTRVQASNVVQARQYLSLRLADVGLTAASVADGLPGVQPVDPERHAAIEQYRLVLKPSDATRQLLDFLRTDRANSVLISFGYLPPADDR